MRKVYLITSEKYIRDLSGGGATKYAGRWNPIGTYVLYTANNPSLAMLEWLDHVRDRDMDEVYFMTTLVLPEGPIKKLDQSSLPENWLDTPPPGFLQQFGAKILDDDKWLGFEVPSVLMPLDNNVVLNAQHVLFSKVQIAETALLVPEKRLMK